MTRLKGLRPSRDLFRRAEGVEHVSRYVTGLLVSPIEEEGRFLQADCAFDKGVLTGELTRLIESKGKHWVSELESSRHILWQGQWQRIDDVAAMLRSPVKSSPLSYPSLNGSLPEGIRANKSPRP